MTTQLWRTITANALWKALQLGSLFLLNIAIARVFRAAGSGDFLFLVANFQLAAFVASLSLESGIQYFGTGDNGLLGAFSRFIFRYAAAATLVLIALLVAVLSTHVLRPAIDPLLFGIYAVGFICGTLLFRFFSVLAYAVRAFVLPAAAETACNLLLIILLALHPSLPVFFACFYLAPLVCGLIVYTWLRRRHPFVPGRGIDFPALVRYAGLSFLANLVFFGVYRVDYWFVAAGCNATELGNYIQASKLAQLFIYLPQVIAMVVFPDVVQGMADRKTVVKLMAYTVGLFALGVGIVALAGNRGLVWLLGSTYDLVYPAWLRLVPGIFALGPLAILAAYFAARNRVSVNLYGGLVGLAVMLAGDILFIPRYHIMGAAWVSSASYAAYVLYEWVAFRTSRTAPIANASSASPTRS
ncbi:MAG TPA: polysaccharide biosynthesis C-terminal domain-containing protein [Dinghuibacter sp.]|uniref:lipopolysaccharide biosynthesis protein n=1 Tax=Dinghuibacter sp. TaxID=2024697 RepID=UPI002CDB7503|nr:polysaccharide biosynthesis C-terminal domain-containing protein [Dinghuibacter sp.]HTJ11078.1 polysaccharide biosynthesis C-terminal domain-containing protein [Dinghuibacter sp.]